MDRQPTCVVHIDRTGNQNFQIFGDGGVQFLVIDDRAAHDRVYRVTHRSTNADLARLIGSSPVGSAQDDRHQAIVGVLDAASKGQRHLKLVESES